MYWREAILSIVDSYSRDVKRFVFVVLLDSEGSVLAQEQTTVGG